MLAHCVVIAGCAGSVSADRQERIAMRVGDATAPPSLRALPEIDKPRSKQLHRGLAQAGKVFGSPLPAAPADRVYIELAAWVEEDVANWVIARRDAVEETRFQFETSAKSDPTAQVIANAVVGLLQEDTARSLSAIPVPVELDSEPEIAALFRELVDTQAAPFLAAAKTEYQRCETGADDADGLERFARFCATRAERLLRPAAASQPRLTAAK
jgi:hypothetical protein